MYTTLSGQIGVSKQIDVIANNLANMNTTGYRSERPLFERVLSDAKSISEPSFRKDLSAPDTFQTEEYSKIRESYSDLSQGPIDQTGNPLDVAIDGKGFFIVQTPNGERYTRAGNFRLDSTNRLVTSSGRPVLGSGGEILLPPGDIKISQDGSILVNGQAVNKLRIVDASARQLVRDSEQLFSLAPGAVASEVVSPTLHSGAIEGSNVNAVRELSDMILASKLFEQLKTAQDAESKVSEESIAHVGLTAG